jgi:hypothetical protein
MSEDESKHFINAPEKLKKEFNALLDKAHKEAKADELGRVDWTAISERMKKWWAEKGYTYP